MTVEELRRTVNELEEQKNCVWTELEKLRQDVDLKRVENDRLKTSKNNLTSQVTLST